MKIKKLLGIIIIDRKLNCNDYVNSLCKKAGKKFCVSYVVLLDEYY